MNVILSQERAKCVLLCCRRSFVDCQKAIYIALSRQYSDTLQQRHRTSQLCEGCFAPVIECTSMAEPKEILCFENKSLLPWTHHQALKSFHFVFWIKQQNEISAWERTATVAELKSLLALLCFTLVGFKLPLYCSLGKQNSVALNHCILITSTELRNERPGCFCKRSPPTSYFLIQNSIGWSTVHLHLWDQTWYACISKNHKRDHLIRWNVDLTRWMRLNWHMKRHPNSFRGDAGLYCFWACVSKSVS